MAGGPTSYISGLNDVPQLKSNAELRELNGLMQQLAKPPHEPVAMLQKVMEYYEPICRENHADYPRRLKDLEELPSMASAGQSLSEFLAETVLDPPEAGPGQVQGRPITLSTTHSAKGQEWPHVFVIWAGEGRFPTFPTLDDFAALEEERRLFYVACTRAARSLTILSPKEHYQHGQGWQHVELTRFISELPQGLVQRPASDKVFDVPDPTPASRGSMRQERPIPVGAMVSHATFGKGKVVGFKGDKKVMVYFQKIGLKVLMLEYANLELA
jgi:DNA helicase-2/ATP-dependent DNA helicase PcrA